MCHFQAAFLLLICLVQLQTATTYSVASSYNQPAQCILELMNNQEFMRCTQMLSTIFTSDEVLGDSTSDPQSAIIKAMCSDDGREAMTCLLRYYKDCPELGGAGMGGPTMNLTMIEMWGSIDVFCAMMSGERTHCTDRNGNTVPIGEDYEPSESDPCTVCQCTEDPDMRICTSIGCDPPDCPNYEWVQGTCCDFVCNETAKQTHCTDGGGNTIQIGEVYHPYVSDPCTICECMEDPGMMSCSSQSCPVPECPNYEWIEGECCQFVCIESESAIIDVRQIGQDGALVQWAVPDHPAAAIVGVGLYYSDGFDVSHDPWKHVKITSGKNMAILRSLDPHKLHRIKVMGTVANTNTSIVSVVVDFSFDGTVGGKFIKLDPSEMKAVVYMDNKPLDDIVYLRTDSFTWIKVVQEPCTFDFEQECNDIIAYGPRDVRLEFPDEMDFIWAKAHF